MRLATLVLPILLISTACSMKDNMDEMHTKTVQMADTTESLEQSTAETKDLLGWVAALQKQGDGFMIRSRAFDVLRDAESLPKKFENATAYYFAYEYQTVSFSEIKGVDLKELRKLLAAHAVIEFAKTLPELLPESSNDWKLDATKTNNDNQTMMALAASLHKINYYQEEQVAKVNLKPISMLDLLTEGLSRKSQLQSGAIKMSDLSLLEKETLREEQVFTHLLKLRYKSLPVIALGRISDIQDGLVDKLTMLFFKWEPKFDDLNIAQIEYASDILDEAVKTRMILEKLNIEAVLDKKVSKILGKLKTNKLREKLDDVRDEAIIKSLNRFDASLNQLLQR